MPTRTGVIVSIFCIQFEQATGFGIGAGGGLLGGGKPWLLGYLPYVEHGVFALRVGLSSRLALDVV